MSIFGKKQECTTLMIGVLLFEDFDHQRPNTGIKEFREPIIIDVLKEHYFEALRPPKNWNYDFDIAAVSDDMTSPEMARFEFRDPETKAIVNKTGYKEMCYAIKTKWKSHLLQRFPKYDREKFEDGFEQIKFSYLPERAILAMSMLLDDINITVGETRHS